MPRYMPAERCWWLESDNDDEAIDRAREVAEQHDVGDEAVEEYEIRGVEFKGLALKVLNRRTVTLYRAVALPKRKPWRESLKTRSLGQCWSFLRSGASTYGINETTEMKRFILTGEVDVQSIDYNASFDLYVAFGATEAEARLYPDVPIRLIGVNGRKLPRPVRGFSGLDQGLWSDDETP